MVFLIWLGSRVRQFTSSGEKWKQVALHCPLQEYTR